MKVLVQFLGVSLFVLSGAMLTGCASKSSGLDASGYELAESGESATGGIGLGTLARVYFEFDSSTISADGKATLARNVKTIKANPKMRVLVEGHTDERGTNEYNISLGERRARAVVDALVASGIARSRIESKSWGEERLLDMGTTEAAHARNRRAEFVILAK